jgi:hypothetical protein
MVMPGRATNENKLYSKLEQAKVIEEVNLTAQQTDEIISNIQL